METIQKLIESADFGTMFKTRGGSKAIFLRLCSNAENLMAEFYIEKFGLLRVDRETGLALYYTVPGTNMEENDIVGLWSETGSLTEQLKQTPEKTQYIDLGVVVNGKKILFADRNLDAPTPIDAGFHFNWNEAMEVANHIDEARLPTSKEFEALLNQTQHEWVDTYDENDRHITGAVFKGNGHQIFIPAAGEIVDAEPSGLDNAFLLWGSEYHPQYNTANILFYNNYPYYDAMQYQSQTRYFSVRLVKEV